MVSSAKYRENTLAGIERCLYLLVLKQVIMELQVIKQRIYTIRGQKVMLDFDLAELYEIETRVFNQAIKRNLESFPEDLFTHLYSYSRTRQWELNSSQTVMSSGTKKNRGKAYLPYAFTEHGVTMLASVLKSNKARQMNIAIVRAFIALRQINLQHYDIAGKLFELQSRLGEHDIQLAAIYDTIENLLDKKVDEELQKEAWKNRERIGF